MFSKTSFPFISLTRPFPRLLAAMAILTTVASLLEGITLSLAIPLLQMLINDGTASSSSSKPSVVQDLTSFFNKFSPEHRLSVIVTVLIILVITKGVLRFLADLSLRTLMIKVGYRLRTICIDRFLSLGLSYYSKAKGGDLLSYVNEQTQRCEQLTLNVGSLFSESLIVLSFLLLLLTISWKLTLIATLLLVVIATGLKVVVANIKAEGKTVSETIEAFSSSVFELISGIRVIKSYTSEQFEADKIDRILQRRYRAEYGGNIGHAAVHPISDTAGIIILILLVFLGTRVLSGSTVLPMLLTFLLVLLRTFPRINRLNMLRTSLATFGESFQSIQHFLSTTEHPDIVDGTREYSGIKKQICFESVTFAYDENSSHPILNEINLTIPKGKVTALVGESGSGKSTSTDLLLRFYDPQIGRVSIDGIDIKSFRLKSLRERIAIVNQDTFLFNATVMENIKYGNPAATDSEVIEAARQAYAKDFIEQLPGGFSTGLGDRGVRLSGGQRQRLAIARAIIRDPEILILDEATSALDSTSEKLVQKALDQVSKNRTVIVIAHRLSTIHRADRIIVMKKGLVIEQGTHNQLMQSRGYYQQLNKDQMIAM